MDVGLCSLFLTLSHQNRGAQRRALSIRHAMGQTVRVRTIHPDRDWQMLLSYLPDDYEQLAQEHRLLNLQWSNAKVTSAQALLRLILLHVGANLPLRQTVVTVAQAGGPKVSQVWLHQ